MENQQTQADQDTQQNYQGPTQSPNPTSAKSRPNYWVASTIVLSIVLILVCLFFYKRTSSESSPAERATNTPTAPIVQPVATEKPTMPSPTKIDQQLKSYDGKFLSFSYSPTWYVWKYGRGVSLDYFQINSVSEANQASQNMVGISFDTQTLNYTDGQTLDEMKKQIEDWKVQYPDGGYTVSDRTIDGLDGLVYERGGSLYSMYEKTVWVRKNNVKYIITMLVLAENETMRNSLTNQYKQDFETILNSLKLKSVDPLEVQQLGNHPD